MKKKRGNGLTLIELMITVSIIGVLSFMARTKIINYREQLKVRQAKAQMRVLEMALKSHFKDTGGYPPAYGSAAIAGRNILGNFPNSYNDTPPSEFINTYGASANHTMFAWEWTLIKGKKLTGDPAAPVAGWMGPYTLSVPNDPWGHRYVLEDWTRYSNQDTLIICLGPKGIANGSAVPAGNPVGGYALTSLETKKGQTQWLDKEGFSIIPRGGNTAVLPDFMRPFGISSNPSDDDYNIVLWLE